MSVLTVYPWPSSYSEFCERNPEIVGLDAQLHNIAQEISLWKATAPVIDEKWTSLSPAEKAHRELVETARKAGRGLIELATWPKVGEYDVPEDLDLD